MELRHWRKLVQRLQQLARERSERLQMLGSPDNPAAPRTFAGTQAMDCRG